MSVISQTSLKKQKHIFCLNRYLKYIRKWNVLNALWIEKPKKCYMPPLLYWNNEDVSISLADDMLHFRDTLNHATYFGRYLLNLEHPVIPEVAQVL
jgi:hypothetical protein